MYAIVISLIELRILFGSPVAILTIACVIVILMHRRRANRSVAHAATQRRDVEVSRALVLKAPEMLSASSETLDAWQNFGRKLNEYRAAISEIAEYQGAFASRVIDEPEPNEIASQGYLSLAEIDSLLSRSALAPPHGFDLLVQPPLPDFPICPVAPSGTPPPGCYTPSDASDLEMEASKLRSLQERQVDREKAELACIRHGCAKNEINAIRRLMKLSHIRHPIPAQLNMGFDLDFDYTARVALCTVITPTLTDVSIVKPRGDYRRPTWVPVTSSERKQAMERILYSLCLRAIYLVGHSDAGDWFDTLAVNAVCRWADRATGADRKGIIASLQAAKSEILHLRLDQADPKTCFRYLKGIATPSIDELAPIRPVFVLNTVDRRIVQDRDVADHLEPDANLAAMAWEDFEHLIRQLLEWEFGRDGVEVKVTRASRDRGVDAIMFDPDPMRGGKFVMQAKRYTRSVDAAAVRDLYGTIINEGANRGILVTTSSYGPDSYAFARDKPISLVDGRNLITMLRRHGCRYRIDIAEARRFNGVEHVD